MCNLMKDKKSYFLTGGLLLSTALFSLAGILQENYTFPTFYSENASLENCLPFVSVCENIHADELSFLSFSTKENVSDRDFTEEIAAFSPSNITQEATPLSYSVPKVFTPSACKTLKQTLIAKASFLEQLGIKDACSFVNQGLPGFSNMTEMSISDLGVTKEDLIVYQSSRIEPVTYEFTTVDDSYFADAVFIGDSRTVGIENYSGIENATFLCKTSLTIYDYDKNKITYEGKKTSIRDVLCKKQFKKIYLMLGINECSYDTLESYREKYTAVVTDILSLQPEAFLFLEGNLSITQKKSDESPKLNNTNLFLRNAAIEALANQKNIFYIDINESTLCEDGVLISDYTWDQVHIKAEYYPVWKDFLLMHGIVG